MSTTAAGAAALPAAVAKADPLVDRLVLRLRGLVDGNCAKADDLIVGSATRTDRTVALQMDVCLGWKSDGKRVASSSHPADLIQCGSVADLRSTIRSDCSDFIESELAINDTVALVKAKGAAEAFRTFDKVFKVRDIPRGWYCHENCNKCVGRGEHACERLGCFFGKIPCQTCRYCDGKHTCHSCGGSGSITVTAYCNGHSASRTDNCRECCGSGRSGQCSACHGSGKITCPDCRGTTRVRCTPCGGQGQFLETAWAWMTAEPRRKWTLASDAPKGFQEAMGKIDIRRVPGTMADTPSAAVMPRDYGCAISLQCLLPHVHVSARCHAVDIHVDAIGRDVETPTMPKFLDLLIHDVDASIRSTGAAPFGVFELAKTARVTDAVRKSVLSGKKFDITSVGGSFGGAASSEMLMGQHIAIIRAYNALGRSSTRRFWALAIPPFLIAATAAAVYGARFEEYDLIRPPRDYAELALWVPDAASVLIVGLTLWILGGLVARRSVRRVLGVKSARRPSQSLWPLGALAMAAGVHYAAIYRDVTPARFGFLPGNAWPAPTIPPVPTVSYGLVKPTPVPMHPSHHPTHRHRPPSAGGVPTTGDQQSPNSF